MDDDGGGTCEGDVREFGWLAFAVMSVAALGSASWGFAVLEVAAAFKDWRRDRRRRVLFDAFRRRDNSAATPANATSSTGVTPNRLTARRKAYASVVATRVARVAMTKC